MKHLDRAFVSVSGGYWTGSSAVVDLLSEHTDCQVVPGEFSAFSFGQFFEEVAMPLRAGSVNPGVVRQHMLRLADFNKRDLYPIRPALRRVFSAFGSFPRAIFGHRADMKRLLGPRYAQASRSMLDALDGVSRSTVGFDALQSAISSYLGETIDAVNPASEKRPHLGVFDQLIAPPFFQQAREVLTCVKFIHVDRDWRDQYISIREPFRQMAARNRALGLRPWGEDLQVIDPDPVRYFLRLRALIEETRKSLCNAGSVDILWIRFEDLVTKPEIVVPQIFQFLALDPRNWNPRQSFFPEKSAMRVGKWKRPPWDNMPLASELQLLSYYLDEMGSA